MVIKKVQLCNFRNIPSLCFEPDENMNIIYGENGQGKTNILEALWLFTGAKSFRGVRDREMVRFGEQGARISCLFEADGTEKEAKITIKERREAEIFGKTVSRPALLAGYFYAVVFSPQDLMLVGGPPDIRRRFLDLAIGQVTPKYIDILKSYNKAVIQRNAVLKQLREGRRVAELLEPFEIKASRAGAELLKYRYRYCKRLNMEAPRIYSGMSGGSERLSVIYESQFLEGTTPEQLFDAFISSRHTDMKAGTTTIGPKRDDVNILINGTAAKNYGSQGQRRSAALCLKLAQAGIMKSVSGENPVALLDDVMSELDIKRQRFILNQLCDWQVFLTCCDPANTKKLKDGKIFHIREGALCTSI